MRFDFENTKPFEVSTAPMLPVGNHIVDIDSATASQTRNGNPQIELSFSNRNGSIRDWLVYAEEFGVSKVVALFHAAGVKLSNADQGEDGQLTQKAVDRLIGKKVGVVVNEEPDFKDKTRMRRRVKGYVSPSLLEDVPADTSDLPGNVGPGGYSDDDIPF